ncbi:MAG: MucBP domain-containing protein, partial [Lactobacillus sp.]|nr:MucBP domain-containing protein [Lactobacillus sp.]
IADGYLVYKQKAQYNIHYIDVNGVEGKTTYEPTDGTELKNHQVTGVGSEDKTYVGDTPDATQKLWSPADYEKAGYVLVGLSDNAKGDLLGKQTLTKNVQDQYLYLKHQVVEVTPHTPNGDIPSDPKDPSKPSVDKNDLSKSYTRNIYYKAKTSDGPTLKDQTTQKVTFEASVYIDKVTHETTGVETVTDVNGKQVQVANGKQGKVTWNKTIVDGDATKLSDASARFNSVDQPTIDLEKGNKYATSDDMTGTWYLVDGEANELDLTPDSTKPEDKTLVYKQKAQYNIHYIDVYGVEDAADYNTKGKELSDHLVQNVGEGKDIYVGDTPDATAKLWSPADYEKAGYVLVGLSDNAKGDLLGKQTLTKNVQDQYVYLNHKAMEITPKTPNTPTNSSVQPQDLTKSAKRIIHYVTEKDQATLLDDTTQKITFEGTAYIDMVTGKNMQTVEGTDALSGQKVLIALTTPGTITWTTIADEGSTVDNNKGSFDQVTKPVITAGKLAGKWLVTEDTANNAPKFTVPDPSDPNFKEVYDVTLKYVQTVDADIVYYDVTNGEDNKIELTRADDNNGDGKVGDKITFATMPKDQIKQFEDQGYVLVSDDFDPADPSAPLPTYKQTGNHFEVRLIHGTTTTPTPKTPNAQKQDTTKTVTRVIKYFDAETHETVADSKTQTVTYSRTAVYDAVTGQFLGFAKITDGKVAQDQYGRFEVDPDLTDKNSWVATSVDKDYPAVDSPDLTGKGYDAQMSFSDKVNNGDAAQAPQADATPEHDGQEVDIYYFHGVDKKVEHQTVTRTIYYRGTSDGGKTYQDVEGLATKDKPLTQSVNFTRTAIIDKVTQKVLGYDTDGDGKVDTTMADRAWVTEKDSFDGIKSPAPSSKGYTEVDKDVQPEKGIKPTDKFDEPIVVTYSREIPTPETHNVTVHYVDEDGNIIKDPVKDSKDYKDGETYDENSKKDSTIEHDGKTYVFTRVKEGDNPTGTINGKDVDVTYVYKLKEEPVTPPTDKTYNVTVNFVDENGNVLQDPRHSSDHKDGTDYNESDHPTTITKDGKTYTYTRVEDDTPSGKINGRDVVITYVYKEVKTPVTPPVEETHHVTVHYVDEDGNVIKDPVKDAADYKNGESYDENSQKDSTIEYDGKTYVFTRVKEGDNPTGTIQGKDVDVTYVYKLKEDTPDTPVNPPVEESQTVIVNFVDENGNVLQDPRHSTDHKNGTNYNETDHPTTITKDGKTYTYTRVEGDPTSGTINGKDVVITYVYKEVETPINPSTPSDTTPTTPSEPSTSSEPTTPSEPSTPDTPETPSTPDEATETSKSAKENTNVGPHHEHYVHTNKTQFEDVVTPRKKSATTAALAESTISPKHRRSAVPQSDRILPQTGEKKTSESAIVGLAALALSGIISLAIDRKKKN